MNALDVDLSTRIRRDSMADKPNIYDDFWRNYHFPNGTKIEFKQGWYIFFDGIWHQMEV